MRRVLVVLVIGGEGRAGGGICGVGDVMVDIVDIEEVIQRSSHSEHLGEATQKAVRWVGVGFRGGGGWPWECRQWRGRRRLVAVVMVVLVLVLMVLIVLWLVLRRWRC